MDKNEGIKSLESAVTENLRLIKEVLSLVQKQGEMIDNILDNVIKARDYVAKAEVILEKEKKEHKKSRKVSVDLLRKYAASSSWPWPSWPS